jgi:hypothetical protein
MKTKKKTPPENRNLTPYAIRNYEFEVREVDSEPGANGGISGIGNRVGEIDSYQTIVYPGSKCFQKDRLDWFIKNGAFLQNHQWSKPPIGMITDAKLVGRDFMFSAEYHSTEEAQDYRTIATERFADGKTVPFSMGFYVSNYEYFEDGPALLDMLKTRKEDLSLWNVDQLKNWNDDVWVMYVDQINEESQVNFAANAPSMADGVRSMDLGPVMLRAQEMERSRFNSRGLGPRGFSRKNRQRRPKRNPKAIPPKSRARQRLSTRRKFFRLGISFSRNETFCNRFGVGIPRRPEMAAFLCFVVIAVSITLEGLREERVQILTQYKEARDPFEGRYKEIPTDVNEKLDSLWSNYEKVERDVNVLEAQERCAAQVNDLKAAAEYHGRNRRSSFIAPMRGDVAGTKAKRFRAASARSRASESSVSPNTKSFAQKRPVRRYDRTVSISSARAALSQLRRWSLTRLFEQSTITRRLPVCADSLRTCLFAGMGAPSLESDSNDPDWGGEYGVYNESSPTFGRRELKPSFDRRLVKVSDLLLDDPASISKVSLSTVSPISSRSSKKRYF